MSKTISRFASANAALRECTHFKAQDTDVGKPGARYRAILRYCATCGMTFRWVLAEDSVFLGTTRRSADDSREIFVQMPDLPALTDAAVLESIPDSWVLA